MVVHHQIQQNTGGRSMRHLHFNFVINLVPVFSPSHKSTEAAVSSEVIAIAVAAQAERGEPPGPPRGPSFVAVQVASAPDRRHYRRRRYGEPSQQPQNAAAGRRSACSTPTVAGDEWPGWPAARAAAFATRRYMCRSQSASVSCLGTPPNCCVVVCKSSSTRQHRRRLVAS